MSRHTIIGPDPDQATLARLAVLVRQEMQRSSCLHVPARDLADGCANWLERLRLRGAAHNTMLAYRSDAGRALAYFARSGVTRPQQVGARLVQAWLDDEAAQGRSPRTLARRLASLRCLWRHMQLEGLVDSDHDPTADVGVRFRPRQVIAPEMDQLLAMVRGIRAERPADQRDRAILRLALDAGLRISELAALDMHCPAAPPECRVDLPRLAVHIIGKGGRADTLPIGEATAREIEAWLIVRDQLARPGEQALFVNARGGRISRQTLHSMVRKRGADAGLDGLHMHLLRHRRIGQVVAQMGVHAGRYMARHASATTTLAVYGQQADEVVRRQIRQACPLEARP